MKQGGFKIIINILCLITLGTSAVYADSEEVKLGKTPECIINEDVKLDVDTNYRASILTSFKVKSYKTVKYRATDKSENEVISIQSENSSENSLGRKYNPINILIGAIGAAVGGFGAAVQCPFKEGSCYQYMEKGAEWGTKVFTFVPETIFSNLFGLPTLAFAVGSSRYMYLTYDFPIDDLLEKVPKCGAAEVLADKVQQGQQLMGGKYEIAKDSSGKVADTQVSGITFEIDYSAGLHSGKHFGTFKSLDTDIQVDENGNLQSAKLRAPVDEIILDGSDSPIKDCHMHQALALNYGPNSRSSYPNEDTCDDNGQLATSGPNAPSYKYVEVSLDRFLDTNSENIVSGATYRRSATFMFNIHGVPKLQKIDLEIIPIDAETVRVRSVNPVEINLANHHVVIRKPFPFMDAGKSVELNLNLLLKRAN